MPIITIGLDLAKSVFQLHAIDENGAVVMRRRLSRGQILPTLEKFRLVCLGWRPADQHIIARAQYKRFQ